MGLQNLVPRRTKRPRGQRNELEALKIEKAQTQEMLKASTKGYNEAVAATYELLCNLLAGKLQTQWDCIIVEMHEHDLWAGPDGKKHEGKRCRGYFAFLDCQELHKLMVFTADMAERQWYYIQQGIQAPMGYRTSIYFPCGSRRLHICDSP